MKKFALATLLTLITASCALWQHNALQTISITADVNANQNNATALDIVFVYDQAAVSLSPKTGPEWFAQKDALAVGLGDAIDVVSLQVPPATVINDVPLPKRARKALAVFAYANYMSPSGQVMGNLTGYKQVRISLQRETVGYEPY